MSISRDAFVAATGREPADDDLDRCNCVMAGEIGHLCCGWDYYRNLPQMDIGPLPLRRDTGHMIAFAKGKD